ncbi:hypothetical protein DL770_002516 [Monosporascus sp. CRB-9-2]|nr:hypothetical protein DL770_002516 [Monosporascus sp. CRB-9-2]
MPRKSEYAIPVIRNGRIAIETISLTTVSVVILPLWITGIAYPDLRGMVSYLGYVICTQDHIKRVSVNPSVPKSGYFAYPTPRCHLNSMALDPVSSLSVAAAVLQFVDFSRQIVCKSKQLYGSISGTTAENLQSQTVTLRLKGLAEDLKKKAKALGAADESRNLQEICDECADVSALLLSKLHSLKLPEDSTHRRWKSFRQALKSVWTKGEVDKMATRLAVLRSELDTEVLICLRESMKQMSLDETQRFTTLDKHARKILATIVETKATTDAEFLQQFHAMEEQHKSHFAELGLISVMQNRLYRTVDSRTKQIIEELVSRQATAGAEVGQRFDALHNRLDALDNRLDSNLRKYREDIIHEDGKKRLSRVQLAILESLRFTEMECRYDSIPRAHGTTFSWIFADPSAYHKPWDSFTELVVTSRLQNAFTNLLRLAGPQLRLCFLIDGLDEYEGDPDDVAHRPWPVFVSLFKDSPGLKLQDLTEDDIRIYVRDKLEADKDMRELVEHEPDGAGWLVQEVTRRASGVFLWVYLVVRSLVRGLRDGDDMACLYRRLCSLPVDIENLYAHILEQIDPEHKKESSMIFQIFRANGNNLDIMTLHGALRCPDHHHVLQLETYPIGKMMTEGYRRQAAWLHDKTVLRLNSRCRGLLEVGHAQDEDTFTLHVGDDMRSTQDSALPTLNRPHDGQSALPQLSGQPLPVAEYNRYGRTSGQGTGDVSDPTVTAPPRQNSAAQRPPHIRYLHRTARDYLEQADVWQKLLNQTAGTGFDPFLTLLMAAVVYAKQCPIGDVCKTSIDIYKYVANLRVRQSPAATALMKHLDHALHLRLAELERDKAATDESGVFRDSPCVDQGSVTSMAIRGVISWTIRSQSSNLLAVQGLGEHTLPYQLSLPTPPLPWLVYALSFPSLALIWPSKASNKKSTPRPLWFEAFTATPRIDMMPLDNKCFVDSDTHRLPPITPDVGLLKHLLESGSNPNERIDEHTIWEYTVYLVHILDVNDVDCARPWLEVFTLMLEHDADPYACCIEDPYNVIKTETDRTLDGMKRGKDDESWDPEDLHPFYHSVTAVVQDVFELPAIPGTAELQSLLKQKKRSVRRDSKRARFDKEDDGPEPHLPDWVSTRLRRTYPDLDRHAAFETIRSLGLSTGSVYSFEETACPEPAGEAANSPNGNTTPPGATQRAFDLPHAEGTTESISITHTKRINYRRDLKDNPRRQPMVRQPNATAVLRQQSKHVPIIPRDGSSNIWTTSLWPSDEAAWNAML